MLLAVLELRQAVRLLRDKATPTLLPSPLVLVQPSLECLPFRHQFLNCLLDQRLLFFYRSCVCHLDLIKVKESPSEVSIELMLKFRARADLLLRGESHLVRHERCTRLAVNDL